MNKKQWRFALVQDNPVVGDWQGNLQLTKNHIKENEEFDLVAFPECFLSGYPLQDLVTRPGFLAEGDLAIKELTEFVKSIGGPSVLIGAPMAGAGRPFNAAFLIEPSGAVRVVRKVELPNDDVFDEKRTFACASADEVTPLEFQGLRLGVQICEDVWHGRVSRALADELADVLFVLNGSPYNRGKDAVRKRHAKARVKSTGLPLIYLNLVGGQDQLVFDGGSFMMNTNGAIMSAPAFQPHTMHVVLERSDDGEVCIRATEYSELSHYPEDPFEADYKTSVLGLRDYLVKTGFKKVFVGISGGLDSAIVATQAVDALGAENVVGVMMSSEFTSEESEALAVDVIERLGIEKKVISIKEPHALLASVMGQALEGEVGANVDLMDENIQSRLRGMILMALSNALGGILLSTGNKSEMAVGFATLYGDMNGGFNPLKSTYKSKAFGMARWRNSVDPSIISETAVANPIPERIIDRRPSAELADGQEDANSLGDYEALDTVLEVLIEERLGAPEAAERLDEMLQDHSDPKSLMAGLSSSEYAAKIARLVRNAQYKRDQSPPGVKTNPTDFGPGWRYPIAGKYTL